MLKDGLRGGIYLGHRYLLIHPEQVVSVARYIGLIAEHLYVVHLYYLAPRMRRVCAAVRSSFAHIRLQFDRSGNR
jgi:hypothetical protein